MSDLAGRHLSFTLDMAKGERIDKALSGAYHYLSRSQWKKLIVAGHVTVNGHSVVASYKIEGDEQIDAFIPDAVDVDLVAEDIPLDILYEDDDLLAVNKPAGMVVHPATGHQSGTLVNAVLHHCPEVLSIGGERRPGIVHRLDKETSGIILVAKHDTALQHLKLQFRKRTIKKRYIALVEGHVQPPSALIDAPIGRDPKQRKRMAIIPPNSSATSREAQTRYEVTQQLGQHALVDCYPLTGRTHQIRVHMAYIGHPLVGDKVYGFRKPTLPLKRHFLHAAGLTFKRPLDDAEMTLSSELPEDLQNALRSINNY